MTVGTSARHLVGGLLTGLPDLVSYISASPTASLFFLNGFQRLEYEEKYFITKASIVSWQCEGVLQLLLIHVWH